MGSRDQQPWVFFDGTCGLCHRAVRAVLASPRTRQEFRFAPIGGATFGREIPDSARSDVANSIVVKTEDGETLTRSEALIHLASRMGAGYRGAAFVGRLVPSWILDLGYDGVAAVRHRLFRRPATACPPVPDEWQSRFGN